VTTTRSWKPFAPRRSRVLPAAEFRPTGSSNAPQVPALAELGGVAQQFLPQMEVQYRGSAGSGPSSFRTLTSDVGCVPLRIPPSGSAIATSTRWSGRPRGHHSPRGGRDSAGWVSPAEVDTWYRAPPGQARAAEDDLRQLRLHLAAAGRVGHRAAAPGPRLAQGAGGGAPFAEVAKRESADTCPATRVETWASGPRGPSIHLRLSGVFPSSSARSRSQSKPSSGST